MIRVLGSRLRIGAASARLVFRRLPDEIGVGSASWGRPVLARLGVRPSLGDSFGRLGQKKRSDTGLPQPAGLLPPDAGKVDGLAHQLPI